jgi:glycerol kinase
VYGDFAEFSSLWHRDHIFEPQMSADERAELIQGWDDAIRKLTA